MEEKCIDIIKKLVNETDRKIICDELQLLIKIINKVDNEKTTILTKEITKEIKAYKRQFKKNHSNITNLYITPMEQPFLYISEIVDELQKETNLKNVLKFLTNIFKKVFSTQNDKYLSLEEEIEIINIAQKKFRFLEILVSIKDTIYLFNMPYCNNENICELMIHEYRKKNIIEIILYNKNNLNIDARCIFTELLGRILNYALVGNMTECPYGMMRFINSLDIVFNEEKKDGGPIIFSSIFTAALLYDTKYKNIIDKNLKEYGKIFEQYIKDVIKEMINLNPEEKFIEVDSNSICPCGSGKKYKDCCKKKKFKWTIKNEKLYREVPINKMVRNSIKNIEKSTQELLGRKTYYNEKIFKYIIGPDVEINNIIKQLRNKNISTKLLYATYKLQLPLSEWNKELLPDYELEDWENAMKEYDQIVNESKDKGLDIDILECINQCNIDLKETWEKYISESNMILNAFINDIHEDYFENIDFEINNINDFTVFCARRVNKNSEALYETLINDHYEVSMAIVRMLYEDLININVYINNQEMFEKHIEPLIFIDKGIYEPYKDDLGNVSNKTAINPKNNEKINYSITLKDLSKKANNNYRLLYDELFKDLSSFTHLNIKSKNTYFKVEDPFFEIQNINIAGILGLFFINQIIYELSNIRTISNFMYRDLLYFSDKVKETLYGEVELLKGIYENKFYDIILECLKDFSKLK